MGICRRFKIYSKLSKFSFKSLCFKINTYHISCYHFKMDPIVAEIQVIRKKILEEYENDIQKYMDHLKDCESRDQDRIISRIEQKKELTSK